MKLEGAYLLLPDIYLTVVITTAGFIAILSPGAGYPLRHALTSSGYLFAEPVSLVQRLWRLTLVLRLETWRSRC